MGWEVHVAKTAFPDFSEDWDRLNRELFDSHPYFDSRFIGPLLKHFATGKELLCIYRTEKCIDGALILQPLNYGRWASFSPSQAQITAVLIRDAEQLSRLFFVLPGFAWSIDFLALDPRYSPNLEKTFPKSLISVQAYTIGIAPHLRFESYWETRPKKLKSNIQRYFKRMENESGCSLPSKLANPEEMEEGVNRFGNLESAGWKGLAGTAISKTNVQGAFYREVMRNFAAKNEAIIYELIVGGDLAASRLVIGHTRMAVCLKTTYAENLSNLAPGRILLYRLIEDTHANRPESTIEFYTNATRDQKEWATFGCPIVNVQLLRNQFIASTFSLVKGLRNAFRVSSSMEELPEGLQVGFTNNVESLGGSGRSISDAFTRGAFQMRIDWFELLQRTVYLQDHGVRYYYAANGALVSVVLPLRFNENTTGITSGSLSNFYTALFSPLKSDEADSSSLGYILSTVANDEKKPNVMHFAPMDPHSLAYHELYDHLLTIGWIPFKFFCFGNWYLKVEKDWEYYLKQRSANLRSRIKRKTRNFLEAGGTLEVIADDNQVERAIAAFQEVYSASWKVPEPYPDFIPALIRLIAATQELRLGIAWLGGKPVAAQLWIVTGDKADIYKVAYHEAFASYSPGTVLTARMLQHVIDRDRVKEVDFLIGDDEYKKEWMSHRRERWGIVAYTPLTLAGSTMLLRELAGRFTKEGRRRIGTLLGREHAAHRISNHAKSPTDSL